MNTKDRIILALGAAILLFASAWLYLWYNKDRYQYIHPTDTAINVVLDKNLGIMYRSTPNGAWRIDYPNATKEKLFETGTKFLGNQ